MGNRLPVSVSGRTSDFQNRLPTLSERWLWLLTDAEFSELITLTNLILIVMSCVIGYGGFSIYSVCEWHISVCIQNT